MIKKQKALIVGGSNGIGLALAMRLVKEKSVLIVDKVEPDYSQVPSDIKHLVSFRKFDLLFDDYSLFDEFNDIDTLIITAGFGKLSLFEDMQEDTIVDMISVNTTSVLRIIKHFYGSIHSRKPFYTAVMVSIAGFMSSPFFSVYGASKAALKIFIESVNVELKKSGTDNRILNVSPGRINGTNFYNGANNLSLLYPLADEIIYHMNNRNDLFIPEYEEVFKKVLERYRRDFRAEGEHSYEYKQEQLKRK